MFSVKVVKPFAPLPLPLPLLQLDSGMSDEKSCDVCLSCHEAITADSVVITCSDCAFCYHAGNCSGVTEGALRAKPDKGKGWRCPTCKASRLRGGPASGKPKPEQEKDIAEKLSVMNHRIGALLPLLGKIDDLLSIKETVQNIEQTVQFLSSKYDELLTKADSQDKEIAELKARVQSLETSTSTAEVRELKREINDLDQYSRRQNLEIHGLEQAGDENLLNRINNIARKLNIPEVTTREVEAIHRLPSRPDKVSVVLVRFSSRVTKEKWMEQRALLRTKEPEIRFFDNLTARNKHLLWLVKSKAREHAYQFVWQKNGRVLVRKRQGEQVIQIKSEDDLSKIV